MKKAVFEIKNPLGIHAKCATGLVDTAMAFESDILIGHNGKKLDMKSIICVMGLGINCGDEITVDVYGDDEKAAIAKITDFIVSSGLGTIKE